MINKPYQLKLSGIGLFFSLASLVLFATCSKQSSIVENMSSAKANSIESETPEKSLLNPFHRSVGGKISTETGKKWIENYVKASGKSCSYTIESSIIEDLLADSKVDGIVMYYAVDNRGEPHILPFGVANGKRIKATFVTTRNGQVSWEEAMEMIANHKDVTRSHFFGANTFQRLIKDRQVKIILAIRGRDDQNVDQLLLFDGGNVSNAASANEEEQPEDKSNVCPLLCVQEE
jgi:hypothetical protein